MYSTTDGTCAAPAIYRKVTLSANGWDGSTVTMVSTRGRKTAGNYCGKHEQEMVLTAYVRTAAHCAAFSDVRTRRIQPSKRLVLFQRNTNSDACSALSNQNKAHGTDIVLQYTF